MGTSGRRGEAGSASTEIVLVTPLLVMIAGIFLLAGQLVLVRQSVDDAARTAAEAAVTGADGQAAARVSNQTAVAVLGRSTLCEQLNASSNAGDFEPGGDVSVTVSCSVRLPRLAYLEGPSSITIAATRSAPLEPYRQIGP